MKFRLTKPKIKDHHYHIGVVWVFVFFFSLLPAFFQGDQAQSASVQRGPSFPVAAERAPAKRILVVATAYSSEVAQTDSTPCIPSNGYDLCEHYDEHGSGNSIAANFLPLETQVRIPEVFGDKVFVVRDRMNKRYGHGRIDIWVPNREEAIKFGVKQLEIELYGGGRWRYRLAQR